MSRQLCGGCSGPALLVHHSTWLMCCPLHLLAWLSQAEQLKAKAPAAIIGVKARQV